MKKYFKNFYKYRFLFTEIVRKNIKLQYRNSVLGMFWTFLQPLLTMIVLAMSRRFSTIPYICSAAVCSMSSIPRRPSAPCAR